MSFWTTPHGSGFRILNFLVRRLPPVRRLQMELNAAVEYHDYYAQSVDRALGQPRGYGDLRMNHVNEIARLRGKVKLTCRDCGAEGPLIGGLCAGCSDAAEDEREGCVCGQGFNPECNAHHDTTNAGVDRQERDRYYAASHLTPNADSAR